MSKYFEFTVALENIQPQIWRRFQISARVTFARLHEAIQESFGWENCHLWEFATTDRKPKSIAGVPDNFGWDPPVEDAAKVYLSTYFGPSKRDQCIYTYDFGDGWRHHVKLNQVMDSEETFKRRLLDGSRACPPEDCGGIGGYERMVHFVETGKDIWDEAEHLHDWLGDWRPDDFDLKRVKAHFDR